jgi:hypothetical protein
VDRQEAAFVVVRVEQRKLLMAVHDIDGVIDVQRDSDRRAWVTGAIGGVDLAPFGDAMCEIVEDTRPT